MSTKKCPLRFNLLETEQACIQHDCEWYIHLIGMNPQTGQPQDEFGCAVSALPILMVENSQQQRQTAASVDKVANEVNKQHKTFIAAITHGQRKEPTQIDLIEHKNGS